MNLEPWRARSPLLSPLDDRAFEFLESVAEPMRLSAGEVLFRADAPANRFFLITTGTIALTITPPSEPTVTVQTFGESSLIGLSWLLPPHRWQWTARAVDDVTLASFDANPVLAACETDSDLYRQLLTVVARESGRRLQRLRIRFLDLYGKDQK
jgi:CRP/FNR family cyclic AMP-dependent transcriptional regulator